MKFPIASARNNASSGCARSESTNQCIQSVAVEHALDRLRVLRLRQRELQQHARLAADSVRPTRPGRACRRRPRCCAAPWPIGSRVLRTTTTPSFAAFVIASSAGRRHVAVADAGDHQPLRAVLHRRIDQVRAHVRVRVEDVDARQLLELVDREFRGLAELACPGAGTRSTCPVLMTPAGPRFRLLKVCTLVVSVFVDVARVVELVVQARPARRAPSPAGSIAAATPL